MSRPFNNANYQALLKGLEITVLRLKDLLTDNENGRWDSEFFEKENLRVSHMIKKMKHIPLIQLVTRIQHPAELVRAYEDEGLHIILAKNVRDNWFNFGERAYMPFGVEKLISQNWIHTNDVLMTRSGANCGQTACWKYADKAFTCADILILRSPKCLGGYLSTYFNTYQGKRLVLRGAYGMAQPHIAPAHLKNLLIPRFEQLEQKVDRLVEASVSKCGQSEQFMLAAEQTLLDALGLAEWQPPDPLTYTCSSQAVLAAGRFDSQYFAPRVAQLLSRLGGDGSTIRDVAPPRTVKFKPGKDSTFRYIEIGDVQSNGTVTDSELKTDSAPSRATWLVKAGDVLTSTVRPNRRLSALVTTEQNGCVASSGFVVLKPVSITPEVLLTYLRLPVFCELMDLHTSASLYPAISAADLLPLPIPDIPPQVSETITDLVRSAHALRRSSQALLERAKHAIELAIEEGEAAGLSLLENNI